MPVGGIMACARTAAGFVEARMPAHAKANTTPNALNLIFIP
jgi:hypothetical protein